MLIKNFLMGAYIFMRVGLVGLGLMFLWGIGEKFLVPLFRSHFKKVEVEENYDSLILEYFRRKGRV